MCENPCNLLCFGAIWNSPGMPGMPAEVAEVVAASAARTLPSTRAGGQDDGSYTNSLKLL